MTAPKQKNPIATFVSELDLKFLLPVAILLALAPFAPEPHLVEKLRFLSEGTLTKPIDIFDLFMHGSGLVLVAARLIVGGPPEPTAAEDQT
jgi:hypothetical protein